MRVNSYNKFFAKVAEIMNTSIKAVKQLDGRYKVELAMGQHDSRKYNRATLRY